MAHPNATARVILRYADYAALKSDSEALQKVKKENDSLKKDIQLLKTSKENEQSGSGIQSTCTNCKVTTLSYLDQEGAGNQSNSLPVASTSDSDTVEKPAKNSDIENNSIESSDSGEKLTSNLFPNSPLKPKKNQFLKQLQLLKNVTINNNEISYKGKTLEIPLNKAIDVTFAKTSNVQENALKEWVDFLVKVQLTSFIQNKQLLSYYEWFRLPSPNLEQ